MSSQIIAISIGLCMAISIFTLIYFIDGIHREIPDDEREHMDPLPLGLKLVWPLVLLFAHFIGERLSVEYIEKSKLQLQRSGLSYLITPQQFFAMQIVVALLFAFFAWACLTMLDKPSGLSPFVAAFIGFFFPLLKLTDKRKKIEGQIIKMLPIYLDFITMAVEAGMNLNGALMQAVDKGPPGPFNHELQKVLRDIKAGVGKVDALRSMADRLEIREISNLVSSLAHAERSGASVGATLRIQSEQRRTERFQRAEKLAMQAPVKLVGPLVMFIFPTTFIILFFPIATQMLDLMKS